MQEDKNALGTRPAAEEPPITNKPSRRRGPAIIAVAMVLCGAAIGAGAVGLSRPSIQMAPATPIAIASLPDDSVVTVKGKVAEIYGNKFILTDQSGRALIETGRAGEDGKLVKADETVSVQGRFEDGYIRAAYLIRPDGRIEALTPPPPPPPPGGWLHRIIGPH